jgi:hypothetical protein
MGQFQNVAKSKFFLQFLIFLDFFRVAFFSRAAPHAALRRQTLRLYSPMDHERYAQQFRFP